jgi:hypothetical protein
MTMIYYAGQQAAVPVPITRGRQVLSVASSPQSDCYTTCQAAQAAPHAPQQMHTMRQALSGMASLHQNAMQVSCNPNFIVCLLLVGYCDCIIYVHLNCPHLLVFAVR